ncbi:metal ABC transporter solute-binding protein, Zn/Mn family [Allokutzneria albata]|uniref:Zinc/manganese transport system substrate-binding protein n=1 Tax=Allokutzneria albata TaxID=211114 RepID=A0A1H0APD9_ALLAB|nr:zinc ABC transporter substrate-binding protein [Allokutzneria albata]SDN35357.1 zinc/manganese transport system substrate-binding protein [Allokutzneria albata]
MTIRSPRLFAGLTAAALLLTGCGGGTSQSPQPGAAGKLKVVASTDVWGDVAATVGGDEIAVKALISGGGVDPHSYQVTPADSAAVKDAGLLLFNGGGYDDAIGKLVQPNTVVIEAVKLGEHAGETTTEGHDHEHGTGGHNEHVWYDFDTVARVADELAGRLGDLKPAAKAKFTQNAAKFKDEIGALDKRVHAFGEANKDAKVIATEPVAANLITHAGLTDVTPEQFSKAVEEGNDPPAAAVAELEKLITGKQAVVLIYNPQTESGVTKQAKAKAVAAGLPVVELTETLPEGKNYLQWMSAQVDALAKALPKK